MNSKYLLISILSILSFSANASSLNVNIDYTCKFNEVAPVKPIQFNKYNTISDYNDKLEVYNKKVTEYKDCVSEYIDKLNSTIDKIESAGRKATTEAQAIKYKDYIETKEE